MLEPFGPVTVIGPLVTPDGASAVIVLSDMTWMDGERDPLKVTELIPVKKCDPVKVTRVKADPLVGERLSTYGPGPMTMKLSTLEAIGPLLT